ncbi:hypothetical protein [Caulobacter sp. UC70_42]|uniref:hypothetical protein n=1 Tax=Caulobacter sp. UC70_42 TaxID=3374551 RepID=UPI0037564443
MADPTTQAAVERARAKFGDTIENGWASEANPTRVGYFVREFTVPRGQMNPGLTWEITDGKGKFWRLKPTGDHKITVTPAPPPAASSLPADFVDAMKALRSHAVTLLQNSEGCAANHYGEDYQLFGMPGWLADARAVVERATSPPILTPALRPGLMYSRGFPRTKMLS